MLSRTKEIFKANENNVSPPNIPTKKNKNAQIAAERMDKKSIANGITFPSIQKIAYTVLFKDCQLVTLAQIPTLI